MTQQLPVTLVPVTADGSKGIGPGQQFKVPLRQGSALAELLHAGIAARWPLPTQGLGALVVQSAYLPQADPEAAIGAFQGVVPVAVVNVHR